MAFVAKVPNCYNADDPSAARRALDIPELFEMILLAVLDLPNEPKLPIFVQERVASWKHVDKYWRDTINSSPAIRRSMFIDPSVTSYSAPHPAEFRYNPLLFRLFNADISSLCGEHYCCTPTDLTCSIGRSDRTGLVFVTSRKKLHSVLQNFDISARLQSSIPPTFRVTTTPRNQGKKAGAHCMSSEPLVLGDLFDHFDLRHVYVHERNKVRVDLNDRDWLTGRTPTRVVHVGQRNSRFGNHAAIKSFQ